MREKSHALLNWYWDISSGKENLKPHLDGAQFLLASPEFDFWC